MDKESSNIYELLYRLGVSANYAGFLQMVCVLELFRADPEHLQLVVL